MDEPLRNVAPNTGYYDSNAQSSYVVYNTKGWVEAWADSMGVEDASAQAFNLEGVSNLQEFFAAKPIDNWMNMLGVDAPVSGSQEVVDLTPVVERNLSAIQSRSIGDGLLSEVVQIAASSFINSILDFFGLAKTLGSPLVLDLDGDGIELTNLNSTAAVYWDIDADGFRNASGWVTGGDGLLAIDKNADGVINDNSELFGNSANFANGFDALAAYDSNHDNVITSGDVQFVNLKVWVDTNGNGYSEGGELHTLDSLGITSITTTYTDTSTNNNGNIIEETSTFVQNGTTKSIVDAWFAYDTVNTVYNGDYTLDVRTLFMPTLRGYGTLADLHIAMSLDNTSAGNLLDKVAALQSKTFEQVFDGTDTLKSAVRDILFRWAGVDNVAINNRGDNVDGRELAFLEKLMGQDFVQRGTSSDPYGPNAGGALDEAFHIAFNNLYARLVVQTEGGKLFTGNWSYDPVSDSFTGVAGLDTARLNELKEEALALGTTTDREKFWGNVVRMVEFTFGTANLSAQALVDLDSAITASDPVLGLYTTVLPSLEYSIPEGISESGTSSSDTLIGTFGNDFLDGKDGADILQGMEGDDELLGGNGDDEIAGQEGSDFLKGGNGNDVYIYNRGDGDDTIDESGTGTSNANDVIVFGEGINLSDISVVRVGPDDLMITISGENSGQIVIEGEFSGTGGSVEYVQLYDQSVYTLLDGPYTAYGSSKDDAIDGLATADTIYLQDGNDISRTGNGADYVLGGNGNDSIYGGNDNDELWGESGSDILFGGSGNDILYGGLGNDTIRGEAGEDIFYYVRGDGDDKLYETGTGTGNTNDVIYFEAGIALNDLSFMRIKGSTFGSADLQITIAGENAGSIIIKDQFKTSAGVIERLVFSDNSYYTLTDKNYISTGTSQDDRLDGTSYGGLTTDTIYLLDGNDTSYAGAGNDIVYGGNGNDNIYGDDGDDLLYGGAGDDRIEGRNGIDTVSYADASAAVTVSLALTTAQNTIGAGIDTLATLENLTGSNFGDTLTGSSSANTIDGGAGDDTIQGGLANDILIGGAGRDTLSYSAATAAVTVSLALTAAQNTVAAGTDTVSGFENLLGSNYNDMLSGDAGDNTLEGAAGDDVLDGGLGLDTASYAGSLYGVTVNLGITGAQNTYGAGTDTLAGIEHLIGSDADDYLYGNAQDNLLVGNGENDELGGGLGNDRLEGGAGSDTYVYNAGDGIDTILDVGSDYDMIFVTNMSINEVAALTTDGDGTLTITFEEGVSAIRILNQNSAGYGVEGIAFEDGYLVDLKNYNTWVLGSAGDNFFYGSSADSTVIGKAGNDVVYGDMGLDNIHGGLGNDTLNGGGDADYLFGEEGNDILMGDTGDDLLDGGDGADQLFGDEGRDTLYGAAGADILYGWDGNDSLSGGADDDTLYGETGEDYLFGDDGADQLFGGFAHDMLYGGIGNDALHGEYDNDTLYGEAENDTLYGDSGNDTLYGGEGNDVLLGGYGWDTLYGGGGLDAFVFKETDAIDHVKDFNTSQGDYLELASLLVGYDPVTSAIADFVTARQVGGDTIISVDRDGAGGQYTSLDVIALDAVTGVTIQTLLDNEQLKIAA
ncbi:MAG: type I secretion C-terminal target domain-containing protein [Pseudobdellovibrionaceae bacterium]